MEPTSLGEIRLIKMVAFVHACLYMRSHLKETLISVAKIDVRGVQVQYSREKHSKILHALDSHEKRVLSKTSVSTRL